MKLIFFLAQIQDLLSLRNNPTRASADVKTLVGRHIEVLDEKINNFQQMRSTLEDWFQRCHGNENPNCAIIDGLNDCA